MSLQSEHPPNAPAYLPGELIADVLSFLPVKSVVRLRCVSKTLNSLISGPSFVNMHLNRSARNEDLKRELTLKGNTLSFTVFRMFENLPIIFNLPEVYQLKNKDNDIYNIVGSCNGLLCLHGQYYFNQKYIDRDREDWLLIWNPATRTISEKIWCGDIVLFPGNLKFGYDNSTNTYKVLYFIPGEKQVTVLTLGNNVWRNIQNSPVKHGFSRNLVHMGNVIWLEFPKNIISLDLGTETYTELQPPPSSYEVPFVQPYLSVFKDCLCFSHDFKRTHFIIWQMKEFGVGESWNQFLKISYDNLSVDNELDYFYFSPLCYSEKNDKLYLINYTKSQAIICHRRFNIVEGVYRVETMNKSMLLSGHGYVESLVWYC